MNRLLPAAAALSLLAAPPVDAALKVGALAPDFSAQASQAGKTFPFRLSEALKKGPVVLYFFPAAFTSGCTLEAHAFADATDAYRKLGATVIGLTAGNIDRLQAFSVSECRSKFPVAADPKATIAKTYDSTLAIYPGHSDRTSFVITPDDRVIFAYSDLKPDEHVTRTLAVLRTWRAGHRN